MNFQLLDLPDDCLVYIAQKLNVCSRFMLLLTCHTILNLEARLGKVNRKTIVASALASADFTILDYLKDMGFIYRIACGGTISILRLRRSPYFDFAVAGIIKNFSLLSWYLEELVLPGEKTHTQNKVAVAGVEQSLNREMVFKFLALLDDEKKLPLRTCIILYEKWDHLTEGLFDNCLLSPHLLGFLNAQKNLQRS